MKLVYLPETSREMPISLYCLFHLKNSEGISTLIFTLVVRGGLKEGFSYPTAEVLTLVRGPRACMCVE